jgi:hypothetical protein
MGKMELDKNFYLKLLGLGFIFLALIAFVNAYQEFSLQFTLWFCYLGIFLIGFGIFFKKDYLIVSQLNILAIPMIIWTIDFLYVLITKGSFLGITNYFFEQSRISNLISLQHIFTLPLSLVALYFIKLKNSDYWKISLFQVFIYYLVIYFFTSIESNINCVFRFCGNLEVGILYPIAWFLTFCLMIFLTNFALNKIFFVNH